MPLSREAIEELKAIHRKETGELLTDDDAWAMGHRLVRIFDVLARPGIARNDVLRLNSNRLPVDRRSVEL